MLVLPRPYESVANSFAHFWVRKDDRYFIEAAQTWMSVISGDLDDFANQVANCIYDTNTTKPILDCVHVDDLIIGFKVTAIDRLGNQFGNTLGSASYGVLRGTGFTNGNSLPVTGYMRFDEADFDQMEKMGYLQAVILHEMGGFSRTLWWPC